MLCHGPDTQVWGGQAVGEEAEEAGAGGEGGCHQGEKQEAGVKRKHDSSSRKHMRQL